MLEGAAWQTIRRLAGIWLCLSLTGCGTFSAMHFRPSNDRDWELEHSRLPRVSFQDRQIEICNFRDFQHCSESCSIPVYRHETVDLCAISTVDLFICYPVRDPSAFAHTFLSFGTEDGQRFYALSVEARRERGEKYCPVAGLMNKYELIYLLASERDLLEQRVILRDEKIHRYRIAVEPAHARSLFYDMLQQVHELESEPQFYNTCKNNCTSNLLKHAEEIGNRSFPDRLIATMPGYSDRFLRRLELIRWCGSTKQMHECSLINDLVHQNRGDPDLSLRIRGM